MYVYDSDELLELSNAELNDSEITAFDSLSTFVVHGGVIHFDDVAATALIRIAYPKIDVLRVSSPDLISEYKKNPEVLVADIGHGDFDHHQDDVPMNSMGEKHAAVGLVYQALRDYNLPVSRNVKANLDKIIPIIEHTDNTGQRVVGNAYNDIANTIRLCNPTYHEIAAAAQRGRAEDAYDKPFFEAVALMKKTIQSMKQPIDFDGLFEKAKQNNYDTFRLSDAMSDDPEIRQQWAALYADRRQAHDISAEKTEMDVKSAYRESQEKTPGIVFIPAAMPYEKVLTDQSRLGAKFVIQPDNRGSFGVHTIPKNDQKEPRVPFPESWQDPETAPEGMITCMANRGLAFFDTKEHAHNAVSDALEKYRAAEREAASRGLIPPKVVPSYISTVESMLGKLDQTGDSYNKNIIKGHLARIFSHANEYNKAGLEYQFLSHERGMLSPESREQSVRNIIKCFEKVHKADVNCQIAINRMNVLAAKILGPGHEFAPLTATPSDVSYALSGQYTEYAKAFDRAVKRRPKDHSDILPDKLHKEISKMADRLATQIVKDYKALDPEAKNMLFSESQQDIMDLLEPEVSDIHIVKDLPAFYPSYPVTASIPVYDFSTGEHRTVSVTNAYETPANGPDSRRITYIFEEDWDRVLQEGVPLVRGNLSDKSYARDCNQTPLSMSGKTKQQLEAVGFDRTDTPENIKQAITVFLEQNADDPTAPGRLHTYLEGVANLVGKQRTQTDKTRKTVEDMRAAKEIAKEAVAEFNAVHPEVHRRYEIVKGLKGRDDR